MSNDTYKIKPADASKNKIKNFIIFILLILLILSIICLFYSVNVKYEPVIDAVQENTQLHEQIAELKKELNDLKVNQPENESKNNTIIPPNTQVDGYKDYQD